MLGTFRGKVLLILMLVILGGQQSPAFARQSTPTEPRAVQASSQPAPAVRDFPVLSVSFGAGDSGVIWPNRWGPVTLTLSGASKPFSGVVVIDYYQDGRPGGVVRRPVACTPGKPTSIPVMINPGRGCRHVGVKLFDQSGRLVDDQIHDMFSNSSAPNQYTLPALTDSASVVVMGVGEPTGAARSVVQSFNTTQGYSAFGTLQVVRAVDDGSTLPTAWTGYDSLLLLALDADVAIRADPRAIAAIQEWVSGGGRLVLFVDKPGKSWSQWLRLKNPSRRDDEGLLDVAPTASGPVPVSLRERMQQPLVSLKRRLPYDEDAPSVPDPAVPAPVPSDPNSTPADVAGNAASSRSGGLAPEFPETTPWRMISLTQAGEAAGWTTRWGAEPSGATASGGTQQGLIAEGPYGFGWVVVVGVDPNQMTTTKSPQAICALWTSLTDHALADWNSQFANQTRSRRTSSSDSDPSLAGSSSAGVLAKANVMERLAKVPIIGHGVFFTIAASLFALALLIGPIDLLLLGKLRARQWSWATSLVWIALASVAAMYLPSLLRAGPTKLNRVSVLDVIAASSAGSGPALPPLAWRASYTGVYASSTATRTFEGAAPGSWWRGVSAQTYSSYSRRGGSDQRGVPITSTVQLLPDFSVLDRSDPWAGVSLRKDRSDGNHMMPAIYKLWTFRAFSDQARVAPAIDATLVPVAGSTPDAWTLTLTGIPESAKIVHSAVQIDGQWRSLQFDAGSDTSKPGATPPVRRATTLAPDATKPPADRWKLDESKVKQYNYMNWKYSFGGQDPSDLPCHNLWLPGADRRGMVINELAGKPSTAVNSGWACVYLELHDMPCEVTFGENTEYSQTVIARVLVKLPSVWAPQSPGDRSKEPTHKDPVTQPSDSGRSGGIN